MAISKLRLWLEDCSQPWKIIKDLPLRLAHRALIGFLESGLADANEETPQAAYELCKMKNLIAVSINEMNELGESTLIQLSAEGADYRTLRLLVDAGADLNATDRWGRTALMKAANAGHTETVKALMQFDPKPEINARSIDGNTAITFAAQHGRLETVQQLVKLKANITIADNHDSTALMKAAFFGHAAIVDFLLECDPGMIRKFDNNNVTPIMMAAEGGHTEVVSKLQDAAERLEQPIHINTTDVNGRTALFPAAMGGNSDTVNSLVSLKADIHDSDRSGTTAIMLAAFNGKSSVVRLLHELHRSQLDEHLISDSGDKRALELVRAVDNQGLSAIAYAARNGKTETIMELIELKADVTCALHALCKVISKEAEESEALPCCLMHHWCWG